MKLMKLMKQVNELNKIADEVKRIKKEIQCLILNLPDNPNIKRTSPHAFTISSSQLFRNPKDNPTMRMDVFFHDYKSQYEYISEVLEKSRPENVVSTLNKIITEGRHNTGEDYRSFNPKVISHLKELVA